MTDSTVWMREEGAAPLARSRAASISAPGMKAVGAFFLSAAGGHRNWMSAVTMEI